MSKDRDSRLGKDLPNLSSSGPVKLNSDTDRPPRSAGHNAHATVLLHGTMVDSRYRIIGALGTGGMGSVYDAVDLQTGDLIALKSLKKKVTREHFQRFKREAEAALSIQHPHVRRVFAFGTDNELPYIVMERLEGETARVRLTRDGAFSAPDAITIGIQLLDALAAAHEAHVLHRDVKPGNLFIISQPNEVPFVKLIDFGLARVLPSGSESEDPTLITRMGAIPGTPAYLAPEQVAGKRALDERVDVWGAALTITEMLLGRQGFTARDLRQLMNKILTSPAPSILEHRSDVPAEVDAVLGRALAKRRTDRWSSAREFRDALVQAWAQHRARAVLRGKHFVAGRQMDKGRPPKKG